MDGFGELGQLWNSGVVQPLVNALVFLHDLLAGAGLDAVPLLGGVSWGLTIILFTVVIKFITIPLTLQQIRSSKAMQELQPQLKELQKKYGKDRERMMQEQMRLYRENKINPAAGCLPLLIQMPVWFGLYQALFALANNSATYGFTGGFLWLPDLATPEGFPQVLAVLTGVSQWVTQRMMTPQSNDPQQKTMNQMMQFMPIMFVFFAFSVPSGLVLYWVTSNLFSVVQQYFTMGWGSLFPLPFIGGPAGKTKAVTKAIEPSSNGRHPATDTTEGRAITASQPGKNAGAEPDNPLRGPGGGKKKRVKRR